MLNGHTEKKIGATLIKLAAERAILHVKLKEHVTRRQGHLFDLRHIPRTHDQSPALRILFYLLNDAIDLVDAFAIRARQSRHCAP